MANNPSNPSNPQPGQQQQQAAAPQMAPQHQQALQAAGINVANLQNLPWGTILALAQALLAILAGKGGPGATP